MLKVDVQIHKDANVLFLFQNKVKIRSSCRLWNTCLQAIVGEAGPEPPISPTGVAPAPDTINPQCSRCIKDILTDISQRWTGGCFSPGQETFSVLQSVDVMLAHVPWLPPHILLRDEGYLCQISLCSRRERTPSVSPVVPNVHCAACSWPVSPLCRRANLLIAANSLHLISREGQRPREQADIYSAEANSACVRVLFSLMTLIVKL